MKTIPRILLLLFVLSMMSMMYIVRCGLHLDTILHSSNQPEQVKSRQQRELVELKQQIAVLKDQVKLLQEEIVNRSREKDVSPEKPTKSHILDYDSYFKKKLAESEVVHGLSLDTEFHVKPFDSFTLKPPRVYLNDPGLGKRVIEMPIGFKRKDLMHAVDSAIDDLNYEQDDYTYDRDDFVDGIFRTVPMSGTHYELYFHPRGYEDDHVTRVSLFQPFAPVQVVSSFKMSQAEELISFILPLSGKLEQFKIFLDQFARVCIKRKERVHLTVVYFGSEGLKEVRNGLLQMSTKYTFTDLKLITLNETFSRGRGLQVGARSWTKGNVLLFLCDVDIMFSAGFLHRCRLNAEKGQRVYYPVVFSLYNPHVVYSLHEMPIPSLHEQLVITKETGFWRDFGYGMTCQYLSDFNKMGGFDEQIHGWGGEDVMLYRKYVKSNILVVRCTDRGIFHLWHEKKCDLSLSDHQYNGCIRSKALNEASHSQLGKLAFKDEINIHKSNKDTRS